jgi:hypothetical protein
MIVEEFLNNLIIIITFNVLILVVTLEKGRCLEQDQIIKFIK